MAASKATPKKKASSTPTKKKVVAPAADAADAASDDDGADGVWDKKKVKAFVDGKITLGELQGFDKKTQYKLADMGYKLFAQGKYTEAGKLFTGLVALDPRDPYFLLACGSIAQKKDDLVDADRWYSEALRHAPDHAVAYANRGEVRMELGRLQEGAADLIEALKNDPKMQSPTTRRARALLVGLKATLDEGAAARAQAARKPQ